MFGYEELKGNFYLREKIFEYLKGYGICVFFDFILIVLGVI